MIKIKPAREIYNDTWINLADITILDEKDKKVEYWTYPNTVNFQSGNRGYLNQWGPIHELYDNNEYTSGHSTTAPDTLYINLNPALVLGSIQITNRKDCCPERIQKYDMEIYNANELLAVKPLTNLGELGKSVTYMFSKTVAGPPGPAGLAGPSGKDGVIKVVGP